MERPQNGSPCRLPHSSKILSNNLKTNAPFRLTLMRRSGCGCRKAICLALCPLLLCILVARAQQPLKPMLFKDGVFTAKVNLLTGHLSKESLVPALSLKKVYLLLQFNKLPGAPEKAGLASAGIHLFDYIPGNTYLAELPEDFSIAVLKGSGVNGAFLFPGQMKISAKLLENSAYDAGDPDNAIAVGFFGTLSKTDVLASLVRLGARVVPTKIKPDRIIFIQADRSALLRIANLPFVSYLGLQSLKPTMLNYNNRAAHGLDALGATSGRNLQGNGVTLGIGDNADPYSHIDFTGRLIDRSPDSADYHGTHTAGSLGGGGILDPRYKGMAPQATIVSQSFTDILTNAPTYVADYNMVLTSNSYTDAVGGCPGEGEYDATSNFVDGQMINFPNLLHDFAAGNDGQFTCAAFPTSFATIKSGLQCAKNIMSAGNLDNSSYSIFWQSSRGPTSDGRIKPEIVTGGTGITSTFPHNAYGTFTGTSMSSPMLTGTLALLYERYRQLNGGADPTAALIKAIACNSATDLGNPGPDYTYGFGMLNARTAVETIENHQYFSGALNNNGNDTYTIPGVPAGAQQVKIMLYWMDPPAAPFSAAALVNNLDLTVVSPDALVHHPMILNSNPGNVNDNAVEGVDNINNIEQVVINTPPGGTFTVKVAGSNIPFGPQNYVIAYQVIQPSVTVEYPFGNETWVPGATETIRLSAYGGDPNGFTLEYSSDNGATWNTISNSVSATTRLYPWTVPAIATNQALIRITRNSTGYSDISDYPFTILGQPVITVTNPCQGYAQIDWSAIPSATSYDIMELKGDTMQVIANTVSTTYLLGNLNRDSSYWLAVRAVEGSSPGRRSIAANSIPAGGSCALSALDYDLTIDSLPAPRTGRKFASSQLTAATAIQVEVKNLGTVATGAYTLSYQVNGGSIVTEPVATGIAPNTVFEYTFTNTYDFSAPGAYTVRVWVSNPGDPQQVNDTLTAVIKQLQNDPVVLNPAFTEGFETAAAQTYTTATAGLTGLDRCDFSSGTARGRARTFINSGFARTGLRCLTLDQAHFADNSSADSLVATFNLSGYSATDQIWLNFYYQNQGIDFTLPGNQVWIRGNDQASWLPVYTLQATAGSIGGYLPSANINVTATLAAATPAQSLSASFQIKFGEQGYTSTNSVTIDGNVDDGYSFDDITLTRSTNDIGLLSLTAPVLSGVCNLSNAETISVKVKNYSNSVVSNVPVSYSINGGAAVTENIPSIKAFDSVIYTFTQKADLSVSQGYNLVTWTSLAGDNYSRNDTLPLIQFQAGPLISNFPYLEGFETDNGHWFTAGVNDDWQWGAPAKTIINKAANGAKCWVTNLTGNYSDNELSYLYSPCFDLSSLHSPVLSFSHIFQMEDDCDCDYHWAEYSSDGINWIRLGAVDSGTNWYDNTPRQAWQQSNPKWHVSSYDIPVNGNQVRFRIVMSSDPGTNQEGVGIDDVHVFDKAPIYSGSSIVGGLAQPVSGNGWVDFSSGGDRIVSINPNGQDLGLTDVGVFISSGPVRNDGSQYYLDRNIVIQPANPPMGNVSVRYYFLDTEAQNLVGASGCGVCTKIHDSYQAGVMQYSSPALTEEDSTLANDSSGTFHFLAPHQDVSIIPYDNGYYAEYQVAGFSEFWINTGAPGQGKAYPFALLSFTAAKSGTNGLLQWSTKEEMNTSRYVIEKGSNAVSFQDIDSVNSIGDSNIVANYSYKDKNLFNGVNFYRLKIVAADGQLKYSPVRSINDSATSLVVNLYPNPVITGSLSVSTSLDCRRIRVTDAMGRVIQSIDTHGVFNTIYLGGVAKGIYFVSILTDAGTTVKKVLVAR
jgi:hypothetical protein